MRIRTFLLGAAAVAALTTPAFADDDAIMKRLDAMQHMIEQQQHQIETQRNEIRDLRRARHRRGPAPAEETAESAPPPRARTQQAATAPAPADVNARLDAQQRQIDQIAQTTQQTQIVQQDQPVWTFANLRPQIQTPDGRFSLAVRGLGQFDVADYMQGGDAVHLPVGSDLSSGSNFRRAQLGLAGKVFNDWSYLFNYEFGGSGGTEGAGRIQSLYAEYDGFAPLALRIGAYPAPGGLEDNTGSPDTIFLERAQASDVIRNAVAGDGRNAASAIYAGERVYASLSVTGAKVADPAVFDEQQALLGRLSGLVYQSGDTRVVLSATGAHAYRFADMSAGTGSTRPFTISASPEITVDSTGTKLVSTGVIDTQDAFMWGFEGAAQWANLYAQAGYFGYDIERRNSVLSDPGFSGWYAQATWVLTGESRGYNAQNAAFSQPKPRVAFSPSNGGWGAWELAARYSVLDLNYREGHAGAATPVGGVRGGEQKIWTVGVNWYPNSVIRFAFDYEHVDVDRLGTIAAFDGHAAVANTQVGQDIDILALRSQISF